MKTKRFILIILTLVMATAMGAFLAACGDQSATAPDTSASTSANANSGGGAGTSASQGGKLAAPKDVAVDEAGKVTWARVADTTGYEVEVNGEVVEARFTNYDLLAFDKLPANGTFTVKVRAVGESGKSDWGESVSYTYAGGAVVTPSVDGLDGTTLKWVKPTYTTYTGISVPYPVVTVNGTENKLAADATSFELSDNGGDVSLYYAADGVYYHDSQKVKLVYDATGKTLSFAAPENVHMEGDLMKFDEVVGANIYYLEDVYNTITQITGSDILDLSSDREGHFLIKAIWAGNTDMSDRIGNSAPSSVTYFTEEQGAGTEANPYLISSTSHLRFIEYYEALGEAKYYKIINDITFEKYTPANDEDFSNFYNLGSLSGVLDGDGHTVENIVVYYKDGYSSIFDSITKDGVIKNLTFKNTKWRTWTLPNADGNTYEKGGECAIFAYTNEGLIENVTLESGSVYSMTDGGAGLVSINRGVIKDCTICADFSVYGNVEAGAFAILNDGTIEHCVNYGAVSGGKTVGGIVGRNVGHITKCGNEGSVTAKTRAGGIVGYNFNVNDDDTMQYNTKVLYCYNKGAVSCDYYAGGIVGQNGSDGFNELGKLAYASAAIYGCYNQGVIKGGISVGGVVGINHDGSDGTDGFGVKACYSTGDVGYNVKSFIAGRIYLSMEACPWATDGGAEIYVHYWESEKVSTTWPGVRMGKETVEGKEFYYANLPAYTPVGIIFSRVSPDDGSVWNQTVNVDAVSGESTWVYYINADWSSGASPRCAGLVAGYNRTVNDCYYISGQTLGGTGKKLAAALTGGGTLYGKTRTEMREDVAEALNTALGDNDAFVNVDGKYPVLKWQSDDKEAQNA